MTGNPEKPPGASVRIVKRTLADGSVKEYRYGRRVREPHQPHGALREIFNEYAESPEFKRLSAGWQPKKLFLMRMLESELGWMTQKDLESRIARTKFYEVRDRHASLPSRADQMMQCLSSILEWAYDRGTLAVNHARRIKGLSEKAPPKHYTLEHEDLFSQKLPDDLWKLYLFALYTGLRRTDICSARRENIKDGWLVVQPAKTRRKTAVWVHLPLFALPPLQKLVDDMPKGTPYIMTTEGGIPWTEFNVSHRWRLNLLKIGIEGTWFNEIRHTTATRLIEAGCTDAERGAVMGHAISEGSGKAYVARTRQLALNAYEKWARALEVGGAEIVPLQNARVRRGKA
jgi:integrase